jgi:hypothetical protein
VAVAVVESLQVLVVPVVVEQAGPTRRAAQVQMVLAAVVVALAAAINSVAMAVTALSSSAGFLQAAAATKR